MFIGAALPLVFNITAEVKVKVKGIFLYSAVSSPLDRSKRFTLLPPLADLFIPTPTRLLREAF